MPSRRAPKPITPQLQFMLICESLSHDADGGVSFLRVFDTVLLPPSPLPVGFSIMVVTQFRNGQGAHKYWLKVTNPDGASSEAGEQEFWLASSKSGHRFDSRVNLGITQYGTYWFAAMLDGREVMRVPLIAQGPPSA